MRPMLIAQREPIAQRAPRREPLLRRLSADLTAGPVPVFLLAYVGKQIAAEALAGFLGTAMSFMASAVANWVSARPTISTRVVPLARALPIFVADSSGVVVVQRCCS